MRSRATLVSRGADVLRNTTTSTMPAPRPRASDVLARLMPHAWWLVLAIALGAFSLATMRRLERVEAATQSPTWSADAPARDASSPTGHAKGQRVLIVPGQHAPSFRWIMEAQIAADLGKLRLRHIDYDARPDGREIRRTAPYRWWLTVVGWVYAFVQSEPLGYGIERGALLADPLLFAFLLIGGACFTARYVSSLAAAAFAGVAVCLFPLAASFQPGAPDPHALAWLFALGSVLPLVASRERVGARRRGMFMAAGISGGLALWTDAASQGPVLLALVLGGAAYEFVRTRRAPVPPTPESWRAWAAAGALTTLAASLFEFAPSHFSWSLEAVHPLHAVIWWGCGELLHACGLAGGAGVHTMDIAARVKLALGVAAVLAWPLVAWLGEAGGLLAGDLHARMLANHPAGSLAPDLSAWYARPGGGGAKFALLVPCFLLFVVGLRLIQARLQPEERGRHAFALVATLVVMALGTFQLRIWNTADVLTLVTVVALFSPGHASASRWQLGLAATLLAFLPGYIVTLPAGNGGRELRDLAPEHGPALVARDFARWLSERAASDPVVLFSSPVFSDATAFYGGFDVIVSSDHDNNAGQLAAVRIASADTGDEVSLLLNARGVTHLALPMWDPVLEHLVRLGTGIAPGDPLPHNAFAVCLREWDVPPWMRPMNYLVPPDTGLQGFDLRVFVQQAEQEPDLALSRLADLFLERGQMLEARSVAEALASYPRSLPALTAIARVALAHRDLARLASTVETLVPHLSRRMARQLPADRRVGLVAVLLHARRPEPAREQLQACLDGLDAATLRTFTPAGVMELLAACRALDMPMDGDLEAVAMKLVPPSLRQRFRAP